MMSAGWRKKRVDVLVFLILGLVNVEQKAKRMFKISGVLNKFQIKTKLVMSFSLLMVLAASIALYCSFALTKLGGKVEILSAEDIPLVVSLSKTATTQLRQQIAVERMVRHSKLGVVDRKYTDLFEQDYREFKKLIVDINTEFKSANGLLKLARQHAETADHKTKIENIISDLNGFQGGFEFSLNLMY